jgi:glutaminase
MMPATSQAAARATTTTEPAPGPDTVTVCTTAARTPSGRDRPAAERELLARDGERIAVVAARGELDFTAVERVLYALAGVAPAQPGWLVLDLDEVIGVRPPARVMLVAALERVTAAGHRLSVVGDGGDCLTAGAVRHRGRADAVAWAEDALLHESLGAGPG